ncbi:hypothetical protein PPL_05798 [Heterostelium album PN500]|uniref:Uncharacterized protein n=1 Tax=Heterostelium pallidum (strain ATCC 26659 / Pp 5 / PN500) TaxID=670386 RepID=D3BB66_HETP5|nr:hypothetical protein PPL_05798 [Heterostelium album PN500]EFA81803.1 hypothetical protein PPL_05798 [Heterostelium album PN500]|eukprot:XP_020433920.1 hypothetical protein PPL_05798 [Heterostelium album PN500]
MAIQRVNPHQLMIPLQSLNPHPTVMPPQRKETDLQRLTLSTKMTYHVYVSSSDWDLLKQIFNLEYSLLENNSSFQFEINKQVPIRSNDSPYKCYSNQFNIDPCWISRCLMIPKSKSFFKCVKRSGDQIDSFKLTKLRDRLIESLATSQRQQKTNMHQQLSKILEPTTSQENPLLQNNTNTLHNITTCIPNKNISQEVILSSTQLSTFQNNYQINIINNSITIVNNNVNLVNELQAKLNHMEAELEHTNAELEHTKAELDHAKAKLKDTETELDHTKAKLKDTETKLYHTKAELDHTKDVLKDTETKLDHTKAELDHTKTELDHTKAKLDHTKAKLDHTKAKLDHTKAVLKDTETITINYYEYRTTLFKKVRAI